MILYHKPPNVITSHSNADAPPSSMQEPRITVYEDIYRMSGFVGGDNQDFQKVTGIQSKLHAIGRLDADTTGLLLLTNDGGLVHHVTTSSSILKTYQATIMGHWNDTALQDLTTRGVDIGAKYGGWVKATELKVLGHDTRKSTRVEITIAEGKNRQVRRMFHAIQSGVMQLKRTRIGNNLTLGDLQQGQWRILTGEEINGHLNYTVRSLIHKASSRDDQGGAQVVFRKRRRKRRGSTSRKTPY